MIYFSTILLSLVSARLYYLGGQKNKNFRRLGCAGIVLAWLWINYGFSGKYVFLYFLIFALQYAALIGYNKWFGRLFGYNDGDVHWPSWFITGFIYAIPALLMVHVLGCLPALFLRCWGLAILVMVIREVSGRVEVEEYGSGAVLILTLLLTALCR